MTVAAKASAWGYVFGTSMLLPGTILLLPSLVEFYSDAIWCLIVATGILSIAAIFGMIDGCCCQPEDDEATTPDIEQSLVESAAITSDVEDFNRDSTPSSSCSMTKCCGMLALWMMIQGGVLFFSASCMYLPAISNKTVIGTTVANLGTWVFRVGSCSYLCGSFISLGFVARSPGGLCGFKRITLGIVAYVLILESGTATASLSPPNNTAHAKVAIVNVFVFQYYR